MHTQFVLVTFSRLLIFFNLGYIGLSSYTFLFDALASPYLLYLCTSGITSMNALFTYYLRKLRRTAILRLEWEVDTELFLLVRPKGLFGEI